MHAQRYLLGQRLQARSWLAPAPGELVWCTAASGWSKSARNVFMAPWLAGAGALLHDARFDPHERLELLERERVNVLCMAPTEYRVIAKRATPRALPDLQRDGRRRRGPEPRGAAGLGGGHGPADPRRLRPDRDRPADREPARRARAAGIDGARAARRGARDRGRRARAGALQRPDLLPRLPRRGGAPRAAGGRGPVALERAARRGARTAGTPATASAATRTAGCTSKAAPTT